MKGVLEEVFARTKCPVRFEPWKARAPFAPGRGAALVLDGRSVGRFGEVSKDILDSAGVKGSLLLAEIDLTALFLHPADVMTYRALPRYPAASRDLALVVKHGVAWVEIESAIREAAGGIVAGAMVFDRYDGKAVPAGHTSLAVNVIYQHAERTLEAEEVQRAEAAILASLAKRFGITLRTT